MNKYRLKYRVRFVGFIFALAALPVLMGNAQETRTIRVLSLDGGGIRGVIEAYLLTRIEQLTGQPISTHFDMIAGTSTGGILALGLTVPGDDGQPKYLAEDLLQLYLANGGKIFSSTLWYRMKTLWGLAGPKYPSSGLEKELQRYFENIRLQDAIVPVLVTGYHLAGSGIEFFSDDAKRFPLEKDCLMRDVARSTSAAPTFFSPGKVNFAWGEMDGIVDGGIYKNNPALLAFQKAQELYPDHRIEVYSFGTGQVLIADSYASASHRGALRWISPVLSHLFRNASITDMDLLGRMCKGKDCLFRLDPRIALENEPMDDVSTKNLSDLLQVAKKAGESHEFIKLCEKLNKDRSLSAQFAG